MLATENQPLRFSSTCIAHDSKRKTWNWKLTASKNQIAGLHKTPLCGNWTAWKAWYHALLNNTHFYRINVTINTVIYCTGLLPILCLYLLYSMFVLINGQAKKMNPRIWSREKIFETDISCLFYWNLETKQQQKHPYGNHEINFTIQTNNCVLLCTVWLSKKKRKKIIKMLNVSRWCISWYIIFLNDLLLLLCFIFYSSCACEEFFHLFFTSISIHEWLLLIEMYARYVRVLNIFARTLLAASSFVLSQSMLMARARTPIWLMVNLIQQVRKVNIQCKKLRIVGHNN